MTDKPTGPRAPRPFAEYRWTPDKATDFIRALAQHGKVAVAARSVGMSRQSAYLLRDRVPGVAELWTRAQAVGRARRLAIPRAANDPKCHLGPRKVTLPGSQSDVFRPAS